MQALANILNTLLDDLLLITYVCAVGGLVWSLLPLKPWKHHLPAESGLAVGLTDDRSSLAVLSGDTRVMRAIDLQRWPYETPVFTPKRQASHDRRARSTQPRGGQT